MSTAAGEVHPWHNLRNEKCPQNDENNWTKDCTCPEPVKRKRSCGLINRAQVRKHLLDETNSRNRPKIFTQVKPSTLDEIEALVKQWLIKKAENAPRKGKTI